MNMTNIRILLQHKNVYSPYRTWSPEKVQLWEQMRLGYVYRQEVGILQRLISQNESTIGLDVACGSGRFARLFCGQYVGLDHSPSMLKSARDKGLDNLVLGDAFYLPFRPRVFNTALFFRFIHHFEPKKVVTFLRGVLLVIRPKGEFVFDLTHRRSIPYLVAKVLKVRLIGSNPQEVDKMFVRSKKTKINAFVLPAISYNFVSSKIAKLIDSLFGKFFPARSFWRVGTL